MGLAVTEAVIESGADVLCLDLPSAFASDGWSKYTVRGICQLSYTHVNIGWLLSVARKHGCIAKSYPIDVTKAEDVFKTFDLSTKCVRYPLRGLVTCAGISGEAPAIEYPEAVVRKIFDVNYFGSLFCAQAAARCFQANNVPGSIVFIASMSGSIANKVSLLDENRVRPFRKLTRSGAANGSIQLFQSGCTSIDKKPRC